MADLIYRQAAIDAVNVLHGGCITDDVKAFVRYQILSVPTADAVEVVRCKDCEYNDHGRCSNFDYFKVIDMGFCDGGIKR